MYRGCRRLVCSLVCVFSILSMLFLDTCIVEASSAVYNSFSVTRTYTYNADTTWLSYSTTATNLVYPNASYVSGSEVYRIPVYFQANIDSLDDTDSAKYFTLGLENLNISISGGNYDGYSVAWLDKNYECFGTGTSLSGWVYNTTDLGVRLINYSSPKYTPVMFWVEVPTSFFKSVNGSSGDARNTFTFTISGNYAFRLASPSEITRNKEQVSDTATQNAVEQGNEISEDTNTKISDFFGSFFDNLLHIFVPEDGYFSTWFDKVNTLLSVKLGMLYAPFDLVISTLQAIYSSSTTESGIPFPGIKWEDTWLIEPFTFTFASLGSDFDDLRDKVYFATDTVLVLTFLMLLQSKVKLILEGHE